MSACSPELNPDSLGLGQTQYTSLTWSHERWCGLVPHPLTLLAASTDAQTKPVTKRHFDLNSAKRSFRLNLKHMDNPLLLSDLNTPSFGELSMCLDAEIKSFFLQINSCLAISTNKC